VRFQDVLSVRKWTKSLFGVVLDIPSEGLTEKVQAVQMVQAFYVRRVAAAVLLFNLDLVGREV
jgi:hypothetical protein